MAGIELRGLTKSFGHVRVLHGIDLAIKDGEFVALVGPSGCGKSTMLRIIAGLDDATDGDIAIGGKLANDLSPRERNVAMVFQSYALYPHMTVAKNIEFNLRLSGMPRAERTARVQEAARLLELTELLERRPAQLSGGQRQRVAMGRAIVRDPDLFLFDEPLSNLDAKLRVQMRAEIKKLHQKVKTTSIYVTHDQVEAMTLADRIVVMNKGNMEQVGTPLELYNHPANLFVAGFIGSPSMNFFTATVRPDGTRAFAMGIDFALPVGGPADRDVTLGIRPEHLTISANPTAWAAEVQLVEPTGSETLLTLRSGAQEFLVVADGAVTPAVGSTLYLDAPSHIHVFDAQGQRLVADKD